MVYSANAKTPRTIWPGAFCFMHLAPRHSAVQLPLMENPQPEQPGAVPETLTAANIPELLKAAESAAAKGWRLPWWRGHADSSWKLIPKVFRDSSTNSDCEMWMLLRFQAGAGTRYHRACPQMDDVSAWLSLMQHYGLPTRLLDWTTSILAAAYFATEASDKCRGKDGEVWGLNPAHINKLMADVDGIAVPSQETAKLLLDRAFTGDPRGEGKRKAVAVHPTEIDLRMTVQQSMFTVHGSSEALDTLFEQNANWPFIKVTIPAAAKPKLLKSLRALGIRRSTLFPDLASLAATIEADYGYGPEHD